MAGTGNVAVAGEGGKELTLAAGEGEREQTARWRLARRVLERCQVAWRGEASMSRLESFASVVQALREAGIEAEAGLEVGRYRLDLAIRQGEAKVDVECDGAPFHGDDERDAERDRRLGRWAGRRSVSAGAASSSVLMFCVREVADLRGRDDLGRGD